MQDASAQHSEYHGPGYRALIGVWGVLMVLTTLTVWVAGINLGFLNVVVALCVASTKAALVVLIFMHLKYESRMLQWFVLLAFVILAIFIGMTFFDTAYR